MVETKTMEDCSIMTIRDWVEKRIFLTDADWSRRIRRFKLRCSNKEHTKWRLSFHKIHDRLSNYWSHAKTY